MCNEEIIKHMEEDMTFRGLAETYIWRVSKYMEFHKGKDIEDKSIVIEDDIKTIIEKISH